MFNFFLDIIFPKYCLDCGEEGEYWCEQCRQKPVRPWLGSFDIYNAYFDDIIFAGDYEDEIIAALLKNLKYKFAKELAPLAGYLAAKRLEEKIKKKNIFGKHFFKACIVPVPLSKKRQTWRGFNQADLISQFVANYFNLKYEPCLMRIKHKKAQAKLAEHERLLNMANCFQLISPAPKRVILIDDVVTTGATINECAKVLKANGTKEVMVLAVAKG